MLVLEELCVHLIKQFLDYYLPTRTEWAEGNERGSVCLSVCLSPHDIQNGLKLSLIGQPANLVGARGFYFLGVCVVN